MQVRLNGWRDGHNPGDVVELPEAEAAVLIHHGAAHPVDDDVPPSTGKVVKGTAALVQATGTGDGKP